MVNSCVNLSILYFQKSSSSHSAKINEESDSKAFDEALASKLAEKEKEWRDKEREYVADLLKQTKELQEALSLAKGVYL